MGFWDDIYDLDSISTPKTPGTPGGTSATLGTNPLSPTGQTGLTPSYLTANRTTVGAPTAPTGPQASTQPVGGAAQLWAGSLGQQAGGDDLGMQKPALGQPGEQPTALPGGQQESYGAVREQKALMDRMSQTTDPAEKARLRDQLSRGLATQLQAAGHKVSWKGDTLVVDGREYVIGDGGQASASMLSTPSYAQTGSATGQPGPARQALAGQPQAAPAQTAAANPGAAHAARVAGQDEQMRALMGAGQTGGAVTPEAEAAFARAQARLSPNSSREEMEAVFNEEFANVPGYQGAYKESVNLGGGWFDTVAGFGGDAASWQGLAPKGPEPGTMTAALAAGGDQVATGGGVDGNAGLDEINALMAQRGFTGGLNPQEQQALSDHVGPPAGPGGTYTQQQMQRARDAVAQYDGSLRTGAAGQPGAAPPPGGGADPNQVLGQINAVINERFPDRGGTGLTPQELQVLQAAMVRDFPELAQGAPITQAMIDKALQYVRSYSGNLENPGGQPPPTPGTGTPEWRSQWEGYHPGEIGFEDLEGLSAEEVMAMLGQGTQVDNINVTGGLGSNLEGLTEAQVRKLMENPHALDEKTLETLKAKSKSEMAEAGQMAEDELRNYGFDMGIEDSNWLRSERAQQEWNKDRSIIEGMRDLDVDAALSRKEDERKATELGMQFTDQQSARNRSDAQLRLQEAQQNIDNQFRSTEEKQKAVQLATDTQLRQAALTGDRLALREQINAKAAELGLEADRVALDYTLGLMADLTERYGIDIARDIDMAKIRSADRATQEEIAVKMAQIAYQYAELERRDAWAQMGLALDAESLSLQHSGGQTAAPPPA